MVKSAYSPSFRPHPVYPDSSILSSFEKIEGSYGGKKKPKRTAVEHLKELEVLKGFVEYDYPGWGYNYYYTSPSLSRGDLITLWYASTFDKVEYKLMNSLYKQTQQGDLSFNLFNFLYEAREIPSLLDPLKVSLKRLKANRLPKGFRRSKRWAKGALKDIASTYVNGNFGWVPTISDSNELTSRIRSLSNSYQRVKRLVGTRRRTRFQQVLTDLPPLYIDRSPVTGGYSTLRVIKATCSVTAEWSYDIPMLNSFAFLSTGLDKMGLHFDLATIWNAVPFSWLVDWVLPIGDALAADRKGWTEIRTIISGTVSWAIDYEVRMDLDSYGTWAERPATKKEPGLITGRYYYRNTFSNVEEYRYPPAEPFGGWNVKRAGILSALSLMAKAK